VFRGDTLIFYKLRYFRLGLALHPEKTRGWGGRVSPRLTRSAITDLSGLTRVITDIPVAPQHSALRKRWIGERFH